MVKDYSLSLYDVGWFATEKRYKMPESIKGKVIKVPMGENQIPKEVKAEKVFNAVMIQIQEIYRDFIAAGISVEDAASILPVAILTEK